MILQIQLVDSLNFCNVAKCEVVQDFGLWLVRKCQHANTLNYDEY